MARRFCLNCGREEWSPGSRFCVQCGDALPEPDETLEGDNVAGAVADLQAQVARLQSQLNRQTQRIYALERSRPGSRIAARQTEAADAPTQGEPSPHEPEPTTSAEPPGARTDPIGRTAGSTAPTNWEWLLGGNWLARIGILALVIGIGFLLRLAFDNDWIGETGRVVLGSATGVLLLGGGEFWSRRYPAWAQAVIGGGVAVLYLSLFAAFVLYELIAPVPALGLAGLVTAAAAGLSVRHESRAVAVLALLGGFATPLFLADSLADLWVLLAYVVILDLGALSLAHFRDWRWIAILAFVGSLLLFGFWYEEFGPGLLLAQTGLTVIFLMFVAATCLLPLRGKVAPQPLDGAFVVVNAAAYIAISFGLMFDLHRPWMGGFTLAVGALYALIGSGVLLRYPEKGLIGRVSIGIAIALLTIAIPVQFEGAWITTAWAVEASLLVRISYMRSRPRLRWAAGAIFAMVVLKLALIDFAADDWRDAYFGSDHSYLPVANWHFLAFAAAVAGMYRSALLIRNRQAEDPDPSDRRFQRTLLIAANGLTLFALSVQIVDAFDREYFAVDPDIAGQVVSLSLSGLWAAYAGALIVLGIAFRTYWLRVAGLGLLAVPVLKLFVYDAFQLAQAYRVVAFIGLGVLLIVGGFLYQRYGRSIRGVLL